LPVIGWGFLGIIGLVPATVTVAFAAVLLVITLIGIPVAALLLAGYTLAVIVLLVWGAILGSTAVGGWVVRRVAPRLGEPTLVRNALWGVALLAAPSILAALFSGVGAVIPPFGLLAGLLKAVGVILNLGALAAGVGALLRTRAGQPAPVPAAVPGIPPAPPAPPPAFGEVPTAPA